MTKDIIVKVLQNAYFSQKLKGEIILYTDLESHYTIQDFKDVTWGLKMIQSISLKEWHYNIPFIEPFHANLEKEDVYQT